MRHGRATVSLVTLLSLPFVSRPAGAATQETRPEPATLTADAHGAAGLRAYMRRDFVTAERHFRAAIDQVPSAAAYFYLAYSVYKQAEPRRPNHPLKQKSADLFAQAYERDPGFLPSWSAADFMR